MNNSSDHESPHPVLHPAPEEFFWYMRQGLHLALEGWPSARLEEFEEHMSSCDVCVSRLALEARDELLLQELALEPARGLRAFVSAQSASARSGQWAYAAVATLALVLVLCVQGAYADSPSNSHSNSHSAPFVPPLDAGLLLADGDIDLAKTH